MTSAIVEAVHPEEIILFGSRAAGRASSESDVDLLVVVPPSAQGRLRELTGQLYRRLFDVPVAMDILVYTRPEVERWRGIRGHIIDTGLREGTRLYARE
jgi:predicted nucleotidyltransferase